MAMEGTDGRNYVEKRSSTSERQDCFIAEGSASRNNHTSQAECVARKYYIVFLAIMLVITVLVIIICGEYLVIFYIFVIQIYC